MLGNIRCRPWLKSLASYPSASPNVPTTIRPEGWLLRKCSMTWRNIIHRLWPIFSKAYKILKQIIFSNNMVVSQMDRSLDILNFWFEVVDDNTEIKKREAPFNKWFLKSLETDQIIKETFEKDLIAANQGEYSSWESDLQQRLALILLFDQFSRNIYRG